MSQEFFPKAATRREMLRAASLLAGGSPLAELMPRVALKSSYPMLSSRSYTQLCSAMV